VDFILQLYRTAEVLLLVLWALFSGYLLTLTISAARSKNRPAARSAVSSLHRFAVLIPAHDEEAAIGNTLASLAELHYRRDGFEVIVVADNCQDRTAEMARGAGATVMERFDPERRGKGFALAWALEALSKPDYPHDAYVVLDADSLVTPNLLDILDGMLQAGFQAAQVYDAVLNPCKTWVTAVRYASFAAYSYVRPLGRTGLGFTAKLQGNGMCLTSTLLKAYPWSSFGLAEDVDYSCGLTAGGILVGFTAEAEVRSDMPSTLKEVDSQLTRWEHGRWTNLRHHVPRLLGKALRQRNLPSAEAALELSVPPLSLIIALPVAFFCLNLSAAFLFKGAGVFPVTMAALWGTVLAASIAHMVGALVLVRAPAYVYVALLRAPIYLARLLQINLKFFLGEGEKRWVRSARSTDEKER